MSSFSADHRGFYRNEKPFFPRMHSNIAVVHLPASLRDDLDWSEEKREQSRSYLLAKPFFGRSTSILRRSQNANTGAFFAHAHALETFLTFSSPFVEHTFGVCVYRGTADLLGLFDAAEWEDAFMESQMDNFHLFSADLLADYLHRLVSVLPDGILPFAFFDLTGITSAAFAAQLLSKERFQYLHLGLKGAPFPFYGR